MGVNEKMTAIANAIRQYVDNASSIKYSLDDMPGKISDVFRTGSTNGYKMGITQGEINMYNILTANGTRTNYSKAFAYWEAEYIRPPITITPSAVIGVNQMFEYNSALKKVEAAYFNFSKVPIADANGNNKNLYYYTFQVCSNLEEIEDVNFAIPAGWTNTFRRCENLKKIARLPVDENTTFTEAFTNCHRLEELNIDGTIAQDGFDMRYSHYLNKDSIIGIINALSDSSTGKTITLSGSAIARRFASQEGLLDGRESEEWAALIATKPNWTITLIGG